MIKLNGALFMALTLVLPAVAPAAMRAEANSAPPYWEGSDSSGAIVTSGQCPVVVEKELLSVNIPEFPNIDGSEGSAAGYAATVTANYTFYNPENYDVSATLLFPSVTASSYAYAMQGDVPPSVSVDGERAEFRIRHSYQSERFDIDTDMRLVTEGAREDDFYCSDLPVTEYAVTVTAPAGEESVYFHLTLDCNPLRTRLLLQDCPYAGIKNGYTQLVYRLGEETKTLKFYVAGEDVSVIARRFTREKTDAEELSGGSSELIKSEPVGFGSFVMRDYREEYGISQIDWYNGYVDMLNGKTGSVRGDGIVYYNCNMSPSCFTQWYEYELHVPAGGRVQNAVTAPLFPSIDGRSNPRYVYTYLLSPAQKWADFKQIDIEIETPFHLESSSLDFVKEGTVYRFSRNALPQGELVFTLTENENLATDATPFNVSRLMPRMQRTIFIIVALAVLAVAITAISLARVKERRRGATGDSQARGNLPPVPPESHDSPDDKEDK